MHCTTFLPSILSYKTLVCDFSEGLDFESVKWDIWDYHTNVHLLSSGNAVQVCTLINNGQIITFDTTKFSDYLNSGTTLTINQYCMFGGQEFSQGGLNLVTGAKCKVTGSGTLKQQLFLVKMKQHIMQRYQQHYYQILDKKFQ